MSEVYEFNGVRFSDPDEVDRLIEAGENVIVVSPEELKEEKARQGANKLIRQQLESKRAKDLYEQTIEGQRQIALSGGSRVTIIGGEDDWAF
jgi:siroheme synthase (precorrin-2 oxidase/ferrochelatase)